MQIILKPKLVVDALLCPKFTCECPGKMVGPGFFFIWRFYWVIEGNIGCRILGSAPPNLNIGAPCSNAPALLLHRGASSQG